MNLVFDVSAGNLLVIFVLLMMVIPFHMAYKRYIIGYRQLWRDKYSEKQTKIAAFSQKYRRREG